MIANYSVNTREEMVVFMLTNNGKTTSEGQPVIRSNNLFYKLMRTLRDRQPNPMVVIKKIENGRSVYNEYQLTNSGKDYAEKVQSIRRVENRE